MVETLVPEEAEAPLAAEPVKINECWKCPWVQNPGEEGKKQNKSVKPLKSTETQRVPVVSTVDNVM